MNDLYIFKQEKTKYEEQIKIEQNEFAKDKLTKDFQDKTKRYLGTAINIINTNFNINYSMNKEAVGLTSSFKKINSFARKSDEEILTEMQQLDERKITLNIDDATKETIGLAIDIVRIYCTSGTQNSSDISNNDINVFEDNKIESSQNENIQTTTTDESTIENDEVKNNDYIAKKIKKDSPFVIYKIVLGLIIIPLTCMLMLGVFLFAANTFSRTAAFADMMSNENYSKLYPTVFYGIIVLLSGLSASFIASIIKGRTNNKIVFTILPFSLILLLMTFSDNIISVGKNIIPLDSLPTFIKTFDYSYTLTTIYGFMLFLYLFSIFQKHTKTSIIEILDILIIIYVGLLPGLGYILNIFEIDRFQKLINPIYNYSNIDLVSRLLLVLCILSNLIYIIIKNKIVYKNKQKMDIANG